MGEMEGPVLPRKERKIDLEGVRGRRFLRLWKEWKDFSLGSSCVRAGARAHARGVNPPSNSFHMALGGL